MALKITSNNLRKLSALTSSEMQNNRLSIMQLCLTWTVKCHCHIWNYFSKKCSSHWINFVNIKLFKIQSTSCCDINVTFISSPKDNLLKFLKFVEFQHVFNFSCIWKKYCKVFSKYILSRRFDIILFIWSFRLFSLDMTIMTNSLWKLFKVLHEKIKKGTLRVLRL